MRLPSININAKSRIVVQRLLAAPGEILVQAGAPVNALTVVAKAEVPGGRRLVAIARQLGQTDVDMDAALQVKLGEQVKQNQTLAAFKGPAALVEQQVRAPVNGFVAGIGPGWILLETEHTTNEIQAFINGMVTRVLPGRGVVIEANGALIEATCGFGGEAYGRLKRLVNSPYEALTAEAIDESASEAIILGGRTLDEAALLQADAWKVRGIVVGSISSSLLALAATMQVRVVATEGFGEAAMSAHTFGVLTSLSRREVSIRGQTPQAVKHFENQMLDDPPLIVATEPLTSRGGYITLPNPPPKPEKLEAGIGSKVRVIQGKYLGSSGTVDLIPPEPQATEARILAPGAFVKLNNAVHFIPWVNLQLIV